MLFCFDTTNHTWSQPQVSGDIPGARDGHSACVINNSMYVFGGYEEETDQFSRDVHMLDLKTMEWRYVKTKVYIFSNIIMMDALISKFLLGRATQLS